MPPVPAEVVRPALLVPQLAFFLCRTVDPAARAATALLGERPDEPTLVPLGVGPGMLQAGRRPTLTPTANERSLKCSKARRPEKLAQAPPPGPSQGPRWLQGRLGCPTRCLRRRAPGATLVLERYGRAKVARGCGARRSDPGAAPPSACWRGSQVDGAWGSP